MSIVIFDLDGTISDDAWRRHHLKQPAPNYKAYEAGIMDDNPVRQIVTMMHDLKRSGHYIVICTGRREGLRKDTEQWLFNNSIPYFSLKMRPEDNYSPSFAVKKEMLKKMMLANSWFKSDILFVVEDRLQDVTMWREQGLICLQCR